MGYLYVLLTIAFTIYGQLAIKWQVSHAGAMPPGLTEKLVFLIGLVFKPMAFTGFVAAFLASLCWMAALTKLPLSAAYPFMSLTFVGTILLSAVLFSEPLTTARWLGIGIVVIGLIVGSQRF